jgi:ABC-type branched-subunit amino acid transport system substrate-binding protein
MGWNDPEFLKLVGPYAEGAIFVDGFFLGSPDPFIQDFVQQYREQFQRDPDLFSAQSYDATQLLLEAIKQGALNRSGVKAFLSTTEDFPAVSGHIYSIQNGEAMKKPFFIQVKKGQLVQIN